MNVNSVMSNIKSGLAAAAVLGMLAAVPAQAGGGGGQIKITHAPTPYRGKSVVRPRSSTTGESQPTPSQSTFSPQVAVMAHSPLMPAARRNAFIHR